MTTDNNTLADVQPGGRVRLGDQPWPEIDAILADAYSAGATGLPFEGIARRAAVRSAVAALSAQPSPGGQDARELLAAEFDKNEVTAAAARRLRNHNETAVEAAALRVIAARQPVGEPVAVVTTSDRFAYGKLNRELPDGTELYAAPPAQQPARVYLDGLDRALGEAIDQRDRYHEVADDLAGHIAAITGVDIGEHSSANCPWQNAIEAAEEYKPAQAVDLGRFRHALLRAIGWSRRSDVTSHPEDFVVLRELLTLIDSKAVGNG